MKKHTVVKAAAGVAAMAFVAAACGSSKTAAKWVFGFQRGLMVASRSQLGLPA
jgi:hypothetical protein